MANRYSPVKLSLGKAGFVRCASHRRYAIVQLSWSPAKQKYVPRVLFRSDQAKYVVQKVRTLKGYSFVFELKDGTQIWEGGAGSWPNAENALSNYEARPL